MHTHMLFYTFLHIALCSRNTKYSVNHLFLLNSSLHIFVHHCTFCASLHTKTSPGGGDGPCIRPPLVRELMLSDARESTNGVKKGVIKELFFEIGFFLVKKGSYMTFHTVKIWKI